MKPLTKETDGIDISLSCEPETIPIEGNASAIGPEEDAETYAWIRAQLDAGNEWAWCSVRVRVSYQGMLVSDQYLGGCSYLSREDFVKTSMYYDDMVTEALDELNKQRAMVCDCKCPDVDHLESTFRDG